MGAVSVLDQKAWQGLKGFFAFRNINSVQSACPGFAGGCLSGGLRISMKGALKALVKREEVESLAKASFIQRVSH